MATTVEQEQGICAATGRTCEEPRHWVNPSKEWVFSQLWEQPSDFPRSEKILDPNKRYRLIVHVMAEEGTADSVASEAMLSNQAQMRR